MEVGIFLQRTISILLMGSFLELHLRRLTSCSDSGTFWSFILWTPAEAEPSSAPAASRPVVFMTSGVQRERKR